MIDLTPTDHPVPLLTRAGADAMRATGPLRFALPAERRPRARRGAPASPRGGGGATGTSAADSLDPPARDCFERLRVHRATMARARGVPAYVVALDRTLVEMASRAPATRAELLDVYGMGPARVEAYGDGFLEVLRGS